MNITDDKIQAALDKINAKKKEVFAANLMKNIKADSDPVMQVKKIMEMRETFSVLAEKANDDSLDLYEGIVDSLSNAISEHAQILIDHANEIVGKIVNDDK